MIRLEAIIGGGVVVHTKSPLEVPILPLHPLDVPIVAVGPRYLQAINLLVLGHKAMKQARICSLVTKWLHIAGIFYDIGTNST